MLRSEASYYGPAYMIDYLWHDYHGMTLESVLINCAVDQHALQRHPVVVVPQVVDHVGRPVVRRLRPQHALTRTRSTRPLVRRPVHIQPHPGTQVLPPAVPPTHVA